MRRLQITCVSRFPLMMDQMSEAVLTSLRTGVRQVIKKDRAVEDIAKDKIYRNDDGKIGIPVTMLYAALASAGQKVAYQGRTNISTAEKTLLFGLLEIQEEFMPFPIPEGKDEPVWKVDQRRGRLADGTAVCLVRPKFMEWGFSCTVDFDDKEIQEGTVRKLFEIAGRFMGLGSFRPSCKGPFGRFLVESIVDKTPSAWLETKDEAKAPIVAKSYSEKLGDGDVGADGGLETSEAGAAKEGVEEGARV